MYRHCLVKGVYAGNCASAAGEGDYESSPKVWTLRRLKMELTSVPMQMGPFDANRLIVRGHCYHRAEQAHETGFYRVDEHMESRPRRPGLCGVRTGHFLGSRWVAIHSLLRSTRLTVFQCVVSCDWSFSRSPGSSSQRMTCISSWSRWLVCPTHPSATPEPCAKWFVLLAVVFE